MTTKTNRDFEAFEYGVAVVQVIDLTSLLPTCGLNRIDDADDFIEAIIDRRHPSLEPLAKVVDQLREMDGIDDDEEIDADMLSDCLLDDQKFGLALQVMTPVRGEGGVSWGHCYSTWVYAWTFDAAWKLAVEWAKERAATHRAKGTDHG